MPDQIRSQKQAGICDKKKYVKKNENALTCDIYVACLCTVQQRPPRTKTKMNLALRTKDRTENTVYVSTNDGTHEAKYRLVDGQWEHETNVAGDLEGHLIAATGSEGAAMHLLDSVLA